MVSKGRGGCTADYAARWARGDYADPREWDDGDATGTAESETFAQFCARTYGCHPSAIHDGYQFAAAYRAYDEETRA